MACVKFSVLGKVLKGILCKNKSRFDIRHIGREYAQFSFSPWRDKLNGIFAYMCRYCVWFGQPLLTSITSTILNTTCVKL